MNWKKIRAFQIAAYRAQARFGGGKPFWRVLNSKPRALKLFTEWATSNEGRTVLNASIDPMHRHHSRLEKIREGAKSLVANT